MDIRDEGPEQTAIRMFNLLKVLKYKPTDDNINQFRQGLVTGDKVVIHPIMKWCLEKLNELKKRAYLARFLVKLDISPEFLSDPNVNDLNNQVLVDHCLFDIIIWFLNPKKFVSLVWKFDEWFQGDTQKLWSFNVDPAHNGRSQSRNREDGRRKRTNHQASGAS